MTIVNNFQVVDQTKAIERIPHQPGLIGALNLYRGEPVSTDAITVDVRQNSVAILDDKLRNVDDKNSTVAPSYKVHTFAIPHYPVAKTIGREKLAGVRAFGKEGEQIIAQAVAEELERQAQRHDLQEEYLKAQMTVNGIVATTYYGTFNMATEFSFTQPSQTLTASTMLANIRAAQEKSRDGLQTGGRVQGYVALVSSGLFEYILTSQDLKDAFIYSQGNGNPLRNELGVVANGYTMFRWGNVDFVLYDDTFKDKDGSTKTVMTANEGVLIPRTEIGRVFYGPASTLSGLGGFGSTRFARSYRDPKDRFVEVESEQSTLVINEQFEAVVKLTKGA